MEEIKQPKKTKRTKKSSRPISSAMQNTSNVNTDNCFVQETSVQAMIQASNIESEIFEAAQDVTNCEIETIFHSMALADSPEENGNNYRYETELTEMQGGLSLLDITTNQTAFHGLYPALPSAPKESTEAVIENVVNAPTAPVFDNILEFERLPVNRISILDDKSQSKIEIVEADCDVEPYTEDEMSVLWKNAELEKHPEFVAMFIANQLPPELYHPLYSLLSTYVRARDLITSDEEQLNTLKKEAEGYQNSLWVMEKTIITESGECQDGNPVSTSVTSTSANFRTAANTYLTEVLISIKDNVNEQRVIHEFSAETARQNIIQLLNNVCRKCIVTSKSNVNSKTPRLASENLCQGNDVMDLRTCIGILFSFKRQTIKDLQFNKDLQEWITMLVALLQRIATWQEHMFILNHVLRCPPRIGNWIARLVYVPPPRYMPSWDRPAMTDRYVAHTVATLAVILLPIEKREKFLEQLLVSESWVVLDMDADCIENDSSSCTAISEEDLTKILNQVPLKELLLFVLHIVDPKNNSSDYQLDFTMWNEQQLLELFAFASCLVSLLREGLRTYNDERYKNFAKRLGCIITNVVKHVSDLWELLRETGTSDAQYSGRLQAEYDSLVQRATCAIFSSQKLGAWQFLAILPYNLVSPNQLWKLFFILHRPFTEDITHDLPACKNAASWEAKIQEVGLVLLFEELISAVPEAETYYLLSTFSSMAMDRGDRDTQFRRVVTLDLFQIGFLSEATKESCSKSARTLLSKITSRYPMFLSDILASLRDKFELAGQLSFYLFRDLPLRQWIPTDEDLTTISHWLLDRHLLTNENNLARLILTNLNYGQDDSGLFLSHKIHCRIAVLVVETVIKYAPEPVGASAMSTVSSYVRSQSSELSLKTWAWDMIVRLRLHILDTDQGSVWTAMANPAAAFRSVPDLYEDQSLQVIARGVLGSQPIACCVAVLVSTWGHSIPEICIKGFLQLEVVLRHGRHASVVGALLHLTPLFLECQDSLVKCDKFIMVLINLLTADKTYMKMAKNLISSEFPGPILRLFGSMIIYQLENHSKYSLASPNPLVRLWLVCLSRIPNWMTEPAVLFILDTILSYAFLFKQTYDEVKIILKTFYEVKETIQSGTMSQIINWISSSPFGNSLLQFSSCPYGAWYATIVIDIEEAAQFALWKQLCTILKKEYSACKTNIDAALKKAASKLEVTPPPTNCLAIYRWSQQALDTPLDHPLLPYIWQRFFSLYLARFDDADESASKSESSCGNKFFDGISNVTFFKRLKSRLVETKEYFEKASVEASTDSADDVEEAYEFLNSVEAPNAKQWLLCKQKLFQTYILWLEEPRLHDANLLLHALPAVYDQRKLSYLFHSNKDIWMEFLDIAKIRSDHQLAVSQWERSQSRVQDLTDKVIVQPAHTKYKNTRAKLINRLGMYDKPLDPPSIDINIVEVGKLDRDIASYRQLLESYLRRSNSGMSKDVQDQLMKAIEEVGEPSHTETLASEVRYFRDRLFKSLDDFALALTDAAQGYMMRLSEHTALDCTLLELVPLLYRNVTKEQVKHAVCNSSPPQSPRLGLSRPQHITCAGAATICVMVSEAVVDTAIKHHMDENRASYEQVLKNCLEPLSCSTCMAALEIGKIIEFVVKEHTESKMSSLGREMAYSHLGIDIFYHLISLYQEDLAFYPPSHEIFTSGLERLAKAFVYGDGSQTMRLLTTLFEESRLMGLLSPYLNPSDAPCYKFLEMYKFMIENIRTDRLESCFVLMSKFDVSQWLKIYQPSLSHRSILIGYIIQAVINAGPNPPNETLMIQEIFRKHLMILLQHSFPEHFGEVLNLLLRGTESQSISVDVWSDFLNTLIAPRRISLHMPVGKIKDELRAFATEQRHLGYNVLIETAHLLGKYFSAERLQYGLYGLYPKYRMYIEPLTIFMGMIGHCLVVSTLQEDPGTLTEKLCTILWPALQSMYSPWIVPFWTHMLEEQTAAWIDQLTDDRSVLTPWIQADDKHAVKVVAMFTESIRFILDTLPGCSNILHYIWEFYVMNYAHPTVKDHVLTVLHNHLSLLAWHQFCPTLKDMDLMFKVANQFLPSSHAFLGGVFVEVPWGKWISNVAISWDLESVSRAHICLLNLIVKLSNEPFVRQKSKIQVILSCALKFLWHCVDSMSYGQVLDWWVFSSDPRVVLDLGEAYTNPIDTQVLALLRAVAPFTKESSLLHVTTLQKRMMFVRACMKMLAQSTSKYKTLIVQNKACYTSFVSKLLNLIEEITGRNDLRLEETAECSVLLKELLVQVNAEGNALAGNIIESSAQWLAGRDSQSIVLRGFLKVLGTEVSSGTAFAVLLEVSLNSYFKSSVSQTTVPNWIAVNGMLTDSVAPNVEEHLVANNSILGLHAILFKDLCNPTRPSDVAHEANVLNHLIDWLKQIKPVESVEAKIPLLWGTAFHIIQRQVEYSLNVEAAVRNVRRLIQQLMQLADDKGAGWGLLGVIGIRKQSPVSVRCRLLSRAIAVYLLAQLPDGGGDSQAIRTSPDSPGSITQITPTDRGRSDQSVPVPSADALKGLRELENLASNKNYVDVKTCLQTAVNMIKNSNNSLLNTTRILGVLANELYSQQFLLILQQ